MGVTGSSGRVAAGPSFATATEGKQKVGERTNRDVFLSSALVSAAGVIGCALMDAATLRSTVPAFSAVPALQALQALRAFLAFPAFPARLSDERARRERYGAEAMRTPCPSGSRTSAA